MKNTGTTSRNWVFWSILFLLFGALIYVLRSVLLPFVVGITLGYLLNPWVTFFEKKGLNRTLATLLVLLIILLILVPFFALIIGVIDEQLMRFLNALPQYITSLTQKIEPLTADIQTRFPSFDAEKVRDYLKSALTSNFKLAGSLLKNLFSHGFAFLNVLSLLMITPVVTFYMLRDWGSFIAKVDSLLPRKSKTSIRSTAKEIDRALAGFIRGQVSVCLILGLYYSLGLYLIGLDLGIVIGFLAGLISFIPYIGSISGFIISILLALAQFDTLSPTILVVLVFASGQFIEGNILTPKLVGDSIGLHPVWIMFALLAGGVLLGILGMLIAVPTAAALAVLLRHWINNYKKSSLYLDA